ncbi:hypothetical protein [Nitrosococcus wardiae]|uniref:Cytochrome c domain-containing protein n=1 Tax=Nitrosococcus wardiae TaxID=1814290 RepID=A0A4P7BVG9_9GAMM|nr:hypothetical protein [Nitrosococcus wardiae]QBQ54013.1 hypothetical protein E3U44_05455 [Nitrosococcus wardiae]
MKLLRRAPPRWIYATLLLGWFGSFASSANDGPLFATYEEYAQAFTEGDPIERSGMDTWFLWTAGNQAFWGRGLPLATRGEVDLLRLLDARVFSREERFEVLGTINDPSCVAPTQSGEHGFLLDDCREPQTSEEKQIFGEPTGIVGLRKFPNPDFDPDYWAAAGGAEKYLSQTQETFDQDLEPPYLIGMSCAVCHASFDPLNPSRDPADPNWENLAPAFGNRFLN